MKGPLFEVQDKAIICQVITSQDRSLDNMPSDVHLNLVSILEEFKAFFLQQIQYC